MINLLGLTLTNSLGRQCSIRVPASQRSRAQITSGLCVIPGPCRDEHRDGTKAWIAANSLAHSVLNDSTIVYELFSHVAILSLRRSGIVTSPPQRRRRLWILVMKPQSPYFTFTSYLPLILSHFTEPCCFKESSAALKGLRVIFRNLWVSTGVDNYIDKLLPVLAASG